MNNLPQNEIMKTYLLFLFSLVITTSAFTQQTGNLTVFSNTGKQFFVILNGERQNQEAETNIRISKIKQGWYNCRVIAADKSFNLVKNIEIKANTTTTYRIKKKRRKFKFRFYNEKQTNKVTGTEDQFNIDYTAGENKNGNTVQVTVTSNGQEGSDVDEGNIYTDQDMTMTFSTGSGCGTNDQEVQQFASTIKAKDFAEDKMKIALEVAAKKCMTINQIKTITNALDFEDDKMAFVKKAYLNCLEQVDYKKLRSVFSFVDAKEEFDLFLKSKGRF